MNLAISILLVIYIITIIISMILDKKMRDLTQEILDFNSRLIDERNEIARIITNSKINDENYLQTLEKIEKVLVKDDQSKN